MTRLLLALGVLVAAVPAAAQTTLYFPVTDAAAIAPAEQSGWSDATEIERRRLADTKGSSAITIGQVVDLAGGAGQMDLDRQYVSTRMDSGVTFTSVSTTVNAVVMMREYAGTDNVDRCIVGIRVLSEDGTTLRATLLAVNVYSTTGEFLSNVTHRNKRCVDGDAVTASYTTVQGDRLVVEIGMSNSTAGTTPQASAKWGENATDCAENDTGTTDCAGWIRFSNTITFIGEPTPAGNMKSLPLTGVGRRWVM